MGCHQQSSDDGCRVQVTAHLQSLALQVRLDWVVRSRQHMHALPIPEHTAEHPAKGQKDLLAGILRAGPPFLPVSQAGAMLFPGHGQ